MTISVIMPVYNTKEEDFHQAIESILNQTYTDFEFIILNDASTNNAEDVVLSYKDERIRYLKNEKNLKLIATSNILIKEARYEYIARLDSDDFCTPDRLEKQVKYLDEHPEVGVLGTFSKFYPSGILARFPWEPVSATLFLRYCANCISNSAVMMRKSIIEKYNIRYNKGALHAEDYKFWADMTEHTLCANYPEVLSYYRYSPDGISATNTEYQNKMVTVITLDNAIKDFAKEKDYMYGILRKYVKGEAVTDEEYTYMQMFLIGLANYLQKKIPPPYNRLVRRTMLSKLAYFVRKK